MELDKHIIVGTLVYTQWNGNALEFNIRKENNEKVRSICFYKNALVFMVDGNNANGYYTESRGKLISPELIKEMYDMGNANITQKIKELCKKGIYRDIFKGELRDWYMSIVLGDAWNY